MTPAHLSELIQWANIEVEEEEMRSELRKRVRIVAVYPKHNVWVWIPQGNLPQPETLNELLTKLSGETQVKFFGHHSVGYVRNRLVESKS